jgi:1-acyl-sn-glycerol-3-phosphate acyltransferase
MTGKLRAGLLLAIFGVATLIGMPFQKGFVLAWPTMARRFPMYYHRAVLRLFDIRLKRLGPPIAEGPTLIVSNHVSWLDISVISALHPVSFVAKREVGGWPFFGTLARLQRSVFIDRDRRHATGTSRDQIAERLEAGDTLVLFAEGTSSDGARVLPFRTAFFAPAAREGVTLQPVVLAYDGYRGLPMNRRLRPLFAWYGAMDLASHLWGAIAEGPIEITVITLDPIPCGPGQDRKALARLAEDQMRQALVRALHAPGKMG